MSTSRIQECEFKRVRVACACACSSNYHIHCVSIGIKSKLRIHLEVEEEVYNDTTCRSVRTGILRYLLNILLQCDCCI